MPLPAPDPDAVNQGNAVAEGTNNTSTWLPGAPIPEPLVVIANQGQAVVEGTESPPVSPVSWPRRRLAPPTGLVRSAMPSSNSRAAIASTTERINEALGIDKPAAGVSPAPSQPSQPDNGTPDNSNPPSGDDPGSGE